jgi:hypothetical protein
MSIFGGSISSADDDSNLELDSTCNINELTGGYQTQEESEDDNNNQPQPGDHRSNMFEICGLKESSNGRSCTAHEVCGQHVIVNDILRLKECIVVVNGVAEKAIKLVKLAGGNETCTVGFIPRIYYRMNKVQNSINGSIQVVSLYKNGTTYEQSKDHANRGMAVCCFIDEIPILE